MTPDEISRRFTRPDGSFRFARWSRPVAPAVYGVTEGSAQVLLAGVRLLADLIGQPAAPTDAEAGFNNILVCRAAWTDFAEPELEEMVPGLAALAGRLEREGAEQYRLFRFAEDGGVRHCLTLMRLSGPLADLPDDLLALGHAVSTALDWAPGALDGGITEPGPGGAQLRTGLIALLRAAYHPALPASADDASFAYRLAARTA